MRNHIYTSEQIAFLSANVKGISYKELTKLYNTHFDLNLSLTQIASTVKRYGMANGRDTRFKLGDTPFNKGAEGGGWEPTQFKKGNRPWNYKPLGTERINCEGYIDVKIADPNKWKPKHVFIWENNNGSLPKGSVVIFGDGDKRNFNPENLINVTRGQLAVMNQKGLIKNDAELTRVGVVIADLQMKISERMKGAMTDV